MDLINTDQYPLQKAEIGHSDYKKCVSDLRSKLVHEGVATCPNFLSDMVIKTAVSDIEKVSDKAFKTDTSHNIYLDSGDPDFSSGHIRNRLLPTTVSIIRIMCKDKSFVNQYRFLLCRYRRFFFPYVFPYKNIRFFFGSILMGTLYNNHKINI